MIQVRSGSPGDLIRCQVRAVLAREQGKGTSMKEDQLKRTRGLSRRGFLQAVSAGTATATLVSANAAESSAAASTAGSPKTPATVRGAFLYPPSASLDEAGYYSWPGSGFDAEGRQKEYAARLKSIESELGMRIAMDEKPLAEEGDATRFIEEIKASRPDGLLLIPFKKGHWPYVKRVVEETRVPSVVLATLGVLLVDHINELHRKTGAYLISSLDNLDAVAEGMRMIRTIIRMKQSRIIDLTGDDAKETVVPHLGTQVRPVPLTRFYEAFRKTQATPEVMKLAESYTRNAKEIVEPTKDDILEAAKTYFVLKEILAAEEGDAIMMTCLPGLQKPHKHVPPCMGVMSLRDEGIPAGCQSDLSSTLTLMLVQQLFDRPGFQQNASMETASNLYFGAHCTSPSMMRGANARPEPYILRSHAEAGWGCVPRVLFTEGEEVTMAQYLPQEKPQMTVYTGKVMRCPSIPPAGGCRTNIEMTINEVQDVCDVKGMHQIIFYGNHAKPLRTFCQLAGIEAII